MSHRVEKDGFFIPAFFKLLGSASVIIATLAYCFSPNNNKQVKNPIKETSSPVIQREYTPPVIVYQSDLPAADFPEPSVDETFLPSDQDPNIKPEENK